jgi:hypothetical protein
MKIDIRKATIWVYETEEEALALASMMGSATIHSLFPAEGTMKIQKPGRKPVGYLVVPLYKDMETE